MISRTKALFDEEQQLIAPGLQSIALLSGLAIQSGRGAILTDFDGKTYLDLNAGVSVASLGHCHPRYTAALCEQLETLTVGSFTSAPRAELVRLIAGLTPKDLTRTQFFSGGSEAVEAAIRLARSYTKRTEIFGFTGGFHGKTAGVLPLSDVEWKHAVGPFAPGYRIVPYPDPTRFDGSEDECGRVALDLLRREIEQSETAPAAIIVEPIQGTAGNIVPPQGFLRRLQDLAHEHRVLLIADEMITGFGRTGSMFASHFEDVVPDIMTLGKGMASGFPMSAVVSTDEIVAAKPFSLPSASSSSYGGNPLAAMAALTTIKTIIAENLTQNAERVGVIFMNGLRQLAQRHGLLANVRGRGLLIGFDLIADGDPKSPAAKQQCVRFFKECLAEGVLLMGYNPRVRLHPPLILTPAQAEHALDVMDKALGRIEN